MHERKTNRMKGYDYSRDNMYYVTICVHDRIYCFGKIIEGPGRDFSQTENYNSGIPEGAGRDLSLPKDRDMTLRDGKKMKIKSLSELIGAYKTTVSKQIHLLGYTKFAWQRSFHDRIIHHEQEYIHDTEYILSNASNWNLKKDSRGIQQTGIAPEKPRESAKTGRNLLEAMTLNCSVLHSLKIQKRLR